MRFIYLSSLLLFVALVFGCDGCRQPSAATVSGAPSGSADATSPATSSSPSPSKVTRPGRSTPHFTMAVGGGRTDEKKNPKIYAGGCVDATTLTGPGTPHVLGTTYDEVATEFMLDTISSPGFYESCTGVLLNSRVVLTSGHCITGIVGTFLNAPPNQYTVNLPNLRGGPKTITIPPAPAGAPFYQTTTAANTITTSSGTSGYAAVVYDHNVANPPGFPPGTAYYGTCSGNPSIYCAPEVPPNYVPTDAYNGFGDLANYCVPGSGGLTECCSAVNAGTCNFQHDVGVIILPTGSISQHPCDNISVINVTGSALSIAGRVDGTVEVSPPDMCTKANNQVMPWQCANYRNPPNPTGFCPPSTSACQDNGFTCSGSYPFFAWHVGEFPVDFCPDPAFRSDPSNPATALRNYPPGDCNFQGYNGVFFTPFFHNYGFGQLAIQDGDSGGPDFVAGTHTVAAVNQAFTQFDTASGGFTSVRTDEVFDTGRIGTNWIQNILNRFREDTSCYNEKGRNE